MPWCGWALIAETGQALLCAWGARLERNQLRSYISNVYDPSQLSLRQLAQLYARRWDIELAFLTIKEYLGMHHWWSGKRVPIEQHLWMTLTGAQLYQALRMALAADLHLDPFDVSLPLRTRAGAQLAAGTPNTSPLVTRPWVADRTGAAQYPFADASSRDPTRSDLLSLPTDSSDAGYLLSCSPTAYQATLGRL